MASGSASGVNQAASLLPHVSYVISDHELPDDGTSVVSSCVLRRFFGFFEVSRERLPMCNQYPAGVLLPVVAPHLRLIVDNFPMLNREQYAEIARAHFIYVSSADRKDHVRDLLRVHVCEAACISNAIVFKLLKSARRDSSNHVLPGPFEKSYRERNTVSQRNARSAASETKRMDVRDTDAAQHRDNYAPQGSCVVDDPNFPVILSSDDKLDIIREWQHQMSPESLKRGCCAVCAYNICAKDLLCVEAAKIPLHLLRNDCLPEHTLPRTYDLELYGRAILYAKGLTSPWSLSEVYMCHPCHSALICKCPHQPVNSLANFQYYGHERLPIDIREAFTSASIFDLMLISRARASQVTHFYMYKPSSTQFSAEEEASQRYNKGNVAVSALCLIAISLLHIAEMPEEDDQGMHHIDGLAI